MIVFTAITGRRGSKLGVREIFSDSKIFVKKNHPVRQLNRSCSIGYYMKNMIKDHSWKANYFANKNYKL